MIGVSKSITVRRILLRSQIGFLYNKISEHNERLAAIVRHHGSVIKPMTLITIRTFEAQRLGEKDHYFYAHPPEAEVGKTDWFSEVAISHRTALKAGWSMVATFVLARPVGSPDDKVDPDEIVLHTSQLGNVEGLDLEVLRKRGMLCDECKTVRRRVATYLLRKGDETKIVGSACLEKYAEGLSLPAWIAYAESLMAFDVVGETIEKEDYEGAEVKRYPTPSGPAYPLLTYLGYVCMEVRRNGGTWVPRGDDRKQEDLSTARRAYNACCLHSDLDDEQGSAEKQDADESRRPSEDDARLSFDSVERVRISLSSRTNLTSGEKNMLALIKQGFAFSSRGQENIHCAAEIYMKARALRRATTMVEHRRMVDEEREPWFRLRKGNSLQGILVGMQERADFHTESGAIRFFQIRLMEPCECNVSRGTSIVVEVVEAGTVVNLRYGKQTKFLEDYVPRLLEGFTLEVGVLCKGNLNPAPGNPRWDLDVEIHEVPGVSDSFTEGSR
jgi:hypothetical protein